MYGNIKKTVITYFILALVVWSAIIATSVAWNMDNGKKQVYNLALNAAQANFNKDESIRLWSTKMGGVYVTPNKDVQPNPYLAHLKHRDVVTQDGQKLTLMNPAFMIRTIMDDYAKNFGISGRIVGQVALNPDNLADEFESNAIDKFIKGEASEIVEIQMHQGKEQLRLIKPFYMKPGCVACHGHLGFKDKDVRGAIGVSIPLEPYQKINKQGINDMMISHTLIYILGLLTIIAFSKHAYNSLKERKLANDTLHELNVTLDKKVQERTQELETILTDLKETQKKLIETEKMSSLGSLVAGVAHEINTPIGNSITGTTQLQHETNILIQALQEETLGKNALIEYLDTVKIISDSMYISLMSAASLVRSFKQVAIDQYIEEKRDFNLKEYCDEVLLSLHNKTKYENIDIQNLIDRSINVYSYAGIFSQAITNFIMNSIIHGYDKDSDKEGKITIEGKIVQNDLVMIYKDDGKGIEEELIGKIFDPFFTTKFGQGGSGLGLSVIYNLIVHKLKGNITCESKVGQGIQMIITIPLDELQENT
ncbi:DUF3365 domain-containing protein [Sulfurimonas sp. SAG-AH-194-L11]|nr:ATP-binding protein [Sulfurimonas sp. SAG-AH-194-L11]MDF1877865.1 DUF3365 domain-containing protein [Sulfurimonas sp. SAG-AH-194-L11]